MRCVIRVDSSNHIGSGHVMRCLNLANSLKKYFSSIEFICRDFPGNLHTFILSNGYKVHLLRMDNQKILLEDGAVDSWLSALQLKDSKDTLAIVDKCDLLIVDHYGIDIYWETRLRERCYKLLVIDDLANRKHDCDFLLDYNFYRNAHDRYRRLLPEHCQTLLGSDYAPINQEIIEARKWREAYYRISDNPFDKLNCLVFMGGMDENNYTKMIVDRLLSLKRKLQITIILGKNNSNIDDICNKYKENENIIISIQPEDYYIKLAQTDFAVGAGGISTLERFCIGVPAYIFQVAENQREVCENLNYSLAAIYLGNLSTKNSLDKLSQIEQLNVAILVKMGKMGKELVKGFGLKLITDRIMRSE